jgi:hypothetical protein
VADPPDQSGVAHEDEAVGPLELGRDRLDERVFLECLGDGRAGLLDQREELVARHLDLACEDDVRHEVVVALVHLVEVHEPSGVGERWRRPMPERQYRSGQVGDRATPR